MNNVLRQISVGVVCKDMLDYSRWIAKQSKTELKSYFPIITVAQAGNKYDELVVTTTASANPEYYDIYRKLNGAYARAKQEAKQPVY